MKKLLLATVATAALSFPALAANVDQSNSTPTQQQMNANPQTTGQGTNAQQSQGQSGMQSQNQSGMQNQQAQNTIDPSQLNTDQIRQLQMSLNKKGFDAGHADGKWGPDTDKALKDFQQQQHMQANGKLDQQTLQALGVNFTAQNQNQQQPSAATTGQSSNEPSSGQSEPQQQNAK